MTSTPTSPQPSRRFRALAARGLDAIERIAFPEGSTSETHWQRLALNNAVAAYLSELDVESLSAAEVSGVAHADRPWKSFTELAYPQFDICAIPDDHDLYDVVICEQVLEHVVDPGLACRNLRRLCVPGGHVIVSTPFLVRVHELPEWRMYDYWRFTPRGLALLLEHAGLDVQTVGAWGNRACVLGNLRRWSVRRWWHSMRNEPGVPLQVWAFARNPI